MSEIKNSKDSFVHTLLNAYSVKEISDIFGEIDNKIISLHQCSSDDFLTLNEHFKGYFRDSKTISSNAKGIFDTMSGKDNVDLFEDIEKYEKDFHTITESFEIFIADTHRKVENINGKLNQLFVPLNNYKQNIMSLKYLATNVKLNAAYEEQKNGESMNSDSDHMMTGVEDLKHKLSELDHILVKVKKAGLDSIKRLEEIRRTNLDHIELINSRMQNSVSILSRKHQEAIKKLPLLTQKTESSSSSLAKVITSLQYHDIIRQKIEHIQHTHKDIIAELNQVDEGNNAMHIQAKTFLKIRDIAGLQAAQLLHANKEYQGAIENITNRFVEIGDDLSMISALGHELSAYSEKSDKTHFIEIKKNLEEATRILKEFYQVQEILKKQTGKLHQSLQELSVLFCIIQNQNRSLQEVSAKILADASLSKQEEVKTFEQIRNLQEDITSELAHSNELISSIITLSEEVEGAILNYTNNNPGFTKLHDFSREIPGILQSLTDNNERIQKQLEENGQLSMRITTDIKKSIEGVKYYDFFEKTIDDIIIQLNTINHRLTSGEEDPASRDENLKKLKERYTMASEHIIHDQITRQNTGEVIDPFQTGQVEENKNNEESDNLELF